MSISSEAFFAEIPCADSFGRCIVSLNCLVGPGGGIPGVVVRQAGVGLVGFQWMTLRTGAPRLGALRIGVALAAAIEEGTVDA